MSWTVYVEPTELNDAEWLQIKYWEEGLTRREIADHLNVSERTVSRRMKRLGVEMRLPMHMRGPRRTPRDACLHFVEKDYVRGAKMRGLSWQLSRAELDALITSPCHYCGSNETRSITRGGETYRFTGIDRMDNSKGYVSDNCVACCSACNYLKGGMEYKEFVEQIARISRHLFNK